MEALFKEVGRAFTENTGSNGYDLAKTLSPTSPSDQLHRLASIKLSTNAFNVKQDVKHFLTQAISKKNGFGSRGDVRQQINGWVEVYAAYWKAINEILAVEGNDAADNSSLKKPSWTKVYDAWKEMTIALHRGYTNYGFEAWTIPCLYTAGKYLRLFAIKADAERSTTGAAGEEEVQLGDDFDLETEEHQKLRDCEQQLKRIFTLCLSDRSTDIYDTRKWGVYATINLLFKTYFKLNSASLARTILKALATNRADMGAARGAEKHLTEAWSQCHKDALGNKERILTYLIPCRLLTTHTLPSKALLEPFPRLQALFLPLARCIRRGDLHGFDVALQEGEEEFVKRRIYLTLERGRDITLRNLLRKVFLTKGFEEPKNPGDAPLRKTRVRVAEFAAAISLGSRETVDMDEVECLLANMIYKVGIPPLLETASVFRWLP
ncbi:COP9 signalosome complex subunit 12 [Verticillium alfalfae VaMs.102]|uniref:COP9 signalosome complex subunit 12 n=1 Tax=Verticillium alfalfae (strain VaMs.102 / ATCC MYA-4576 / FGSC 10136) TaxID=526221 RepID=C9SEV6_VERA1|nr:COP9 signalosome complex subunit 12 [Verticillium alfalfae VaMs.102]EEY17742.1 COP9 signalosome complex subunit 12 [Verticillium alfalfae VaMs.102]